MNYVDIIIAVSLLYGLIKGFSNGLIKEITNVVYNNYLDQITDPSIAPIIYHKEN